MINEVEAYGYMVWIGVGYAVAFVFTAGKITDTVPIWQPLAAAGALYLAIDRGKDSTLFD